jgi:oligopeptide/dipeptide ABC transporter ATP-binding protein
MRQRVMIAMALAAEPRLLLADEPTTALDVTVQAQILDLLRDLQEQFDLSVLLVTHSMGVVAELCNGVSVLYAGHLVESGPVDAVFAAPAHPYTRGLLLSVPEIESAQGRRMRTIRGAMPDPRAMPPGCPFAPRCDQHRETCDRGPPALRPAGPARRAACVLVGEQKEARHAAG